MLLSLRLNNCAIYSTEAEFSMRANGKYRRFPNNVASFGNIRALKSAILIGPNNTGKTNFVHAISMMRNVMLNRKAHIESNLFVESTITEMSVAFLENGGEYRFEFGYDTSADEYVYEKFVVIKRNGKEMTEKSLLERNTITGSYCSPDSTLANSMKVASKNNILIYLMDTESFPLLGEIKAIMTGFASRIDIVNSNNIPLQKTIEMLKQSGKNGKMVTSLIRHADLDMDDYRYISDENIKIVLDSVSDNGVDHLESALLSKTASPIIEMLHLTSVYKGVPVPSVIFDSTGTKKIAALASYVVEALQVGRVLIVDELDSSLHFRLTRAIISLFNNELNTSAQLIATVHDVSLLDCQKMFRKEQIWFTHKDQNSAYLYSLAEFTAEADGVRDTSDLIGKYKKGVFGAIPEPDLFQTLLEVMSSGESNPEKSGT